MKIKQKKVFIIILIILLLTLLFCPKNKRIYIFNDINGKSTDFFTNTQLKELESRNAILALSIGESMYSKKEIVNFHVFSINNFSIFRPKSFTIIYNGKSKVIDTDIQYNVNINNPNFEREATYELYDKTIKGFEKEIYGGFENFDYCLIDFNDVFRRGNKNNNEKFYVTINVNYYLDDIEYNQELNYLVECLNIKFNFLTYFLSKFFPNII